jgi:hypothetical protein
MFNGSSANRVVTGVVISPTTVCRASEVEGSAASKHHTKHSTRSVHATGLKRYFAMSLSPLNPFAAIFSNHPELRSRSSIVNSSLSISSTHERPVFDILSLGKPEPEAPPAPEPTPVWLKSGAEDSSATVQLMPYEYVSEKGAEDSFEMAIALADYFVDLWLAEAGEAHGAAIETVTNG